MQKKRILDSSKYRADVTTEVGIPPIPGDINRYQLPRDEVSGRINTLLIQIFDDSDLHATVRLFDMPLLFAHYSNVPPPRIDDYYIGYKHLRLDPEKRMVLIRQDPVPWRDHGWDHGWNEYRLFRTPRGVFYKTFKTFTLEELEERKRLKLLSGREDIPPPVKPGFVQIIGDDVDYCEAVLAANDIAGHEFRCNWDGKRALTPEQILESLEKAVTKLIKTMG